MTRKRLVTLLAQELGLPETLHEEILLAVKARNGAAGMARGLIDELDRERRRVERLRGALLAVDPDADIEGIERVWG